MPNLFRMEASYAPALLVLIVVAIIGAVVLVRRAPVAAAPEPLLPPEPSRAIPVLQGALLPSQPPIVDGLRVSWSYAPATAESASGGDFYDGFFLDDGTFAVVIGDASGHGLTAVVAMNTVRQAIRGALIDGARPADALRRANRVLLRSENPGIVTALVGIIDPATLQFRYAGAGHPAPLLAAANNACTTLPGAGSGIALGVVPHHVTSEYAQAIPLDGMLALYTDGCVNVDRDGIGGTQTLADALVATRTLAPSKPAVTIDLAIFGQREREDDATILTITPEASLAHLDVRLPADPTSAPLARTALRRFLNATPLGERRAFDALVAAGEAIANAIEHAYDRKPNQTFVLRARYENDRCTIFVEDAGSWHEPAPSGQRGRGIAMMHELCDACEITHTATGTTVILTFPVASDIADVSLALR
jgi:anti-sigma regulatory factor (Ser/Thr protein kinase)